MLLDSLGPWLRQKGVDVPEPVRAARVGAGQSNETFLLSGARSDLILRRPPAGSHGATAHDVLREARILTALAGTGVPVPAVVALEEAPSLLGVPFYVMECVPGTVLAGETEASGLSPEEKERLSEDVVDMLARLHLLDVDGLGLSWLGRREGYVARQARGRVPARSRPRAEPQRVGLLQPLRPRTARRRIPPAGRPPQRRTR